MEGLRKSDLEHIVKDLGLTPIMNEKGVVTVNTLIKTLGYYYKDSLGVKDRGLDFRLRGEPMVSYRYSDLKEEEKREVYNSSNWVFTEKINGVRGWLSVFDGVVSIYGRDIDYNYFLPKLFKLKGLECLSGFKDFVLDVELYPKQGLRDFLLVNGYDVESDLEALILIINDGLYEIQDLYYKVCGDYNFYSIYIITPLMWEGVELFEVSNMDRFLMIDGILSKISVGLDFKKLRYELVYKESFFEDIIKSGGEGVIAFHKSGLYDLSGSRKRGNWVKIKKSLSNFVSMGDTVDLWISGYEVLQGGGMIGSLKVSSYVRKVDGSVVEEELGKIVNIPLSLRKEMSVVVDGEVRLNGEFLDRVVEVDASGFNRFGKLINPKFIRLRDDKSKDLCFLEEEYIKSRILI